MDIRSTLLCSVLFGSFLAVSVTAHADGVYVLGALGQSHTKLKDISKSDVDATFANLDSSTLSLNDVGSKLQVGYQFSPNFAIEGGYVNLGKTEYKNTTGTAPNTTDNKFTYENKGFDVEGLAILPVNAGVSVFVKAGLIRARTTLKQFDASSHSTTKTAPVVGLGIDWNCWQGLSVRGEWEHFDKLSDKNTLGTEISSDLFSVGVSYKFSL